MRDGVFSLYKYWKNITKPIYYNVVSLPGESFEFELKALELEKEGEYMTLHMYEKLEKVHSKQKSVVKKNDLLNQEGVFYKTSRSPLSLRLPMLPLLRGLTCAETPPQKMLNFSAILWRRSRYWLLPLPTVFVAPLEWTRTFWPLGR